HISIPIDIQARPVNTNWEPFQIPPCPKASEDDLLKAHKTLMQGLINDAGIYRQGGVGVVDGEKVIHIAPPFKRVPSLMGDLFDYLANYEEEIILKSCVFHYEFEFIHPFSDGNGRMGRFWQTLILKEAYPLLEFVPFETIIFRHQQAYYKALADSQSLSSSEPFIYFMLNALETALAETLESPIPNLKPEERISAFKEFWKKESFSRKDYQNYHKDISTATASRDLQIATDLDLVLKEGDKRTTRYSFKS
ncbi:MAG: Fic family protein, partial [Bacteroidota bacterium]